MGDAISFTIARREWGKFGAAVIVVGALNYFFFFFRNRLEWRAGLLLWRGWMDGWMDGWRIVLEEAV